MPRILNVNLPKDKATVIGLSYIKGIGLGRSKIICAKLNIPENKKLGELSKDNLKAITDFIDNSYVIGNKLVREKITNIKIIDCCLIFPKTAIIAIFASLRK